MGDDQMKLRVTRFHHTHKGKTYRVNETFVGTNKLLEAFSDRLELASLQDASKAAEVAEEEAAAKAKAEEEAAAKAAEEAAAKAKATTPKKG